MPELPEVETTVRQLQKTVIQRKIIDAWTDWPKLIKRPKSFDGFKRKIKGRVIKKVERRGKNIIFSLSGDFSLLVHQKMTGHLLYGKWERDNNKWRAVTKGPIQSDSQNRFLHLILFLDNGFQLGLSDLRKFARIELWETQALWKSQEMKKIGPDAISPELTFEKFKERITQKKGFIKKVLMDQGVIAGIGNIYGDEILFRAGVQPTRLVKTLKEQELKEIYQSIRPVLKEAIKLKGTSISDYRTLEGKKGRFEFRLQVYQREGEECFRCKTKIKRVKINNRSAHFCPNCQK